MNLKEEEKRLKFHHALSCPIYYIAYQMGFANSVSSHGRLIRVKYYVSHQIFKTYHFSQQTFLKINWIIKLFKTNHSSCTVSRFHNFVETLTLLCDWCSWSNDINKLKGLLFYIQFCFYNVHLNILTLLSFNLIYMFIIGEYSCDLILTVLLS